MSVGDSLIRVAHSFLIGCLIGAITVIALVVATVGLITMVAIIGMLSWWIVPHYTTYNDSPSSYLSEMSG